jgi:hypothetical protein
MSGHGDRPFIWSELGGGWLQHWMLLLSLEDTIPEIDQPLEIGGVQLTLHEAYAAISCLYYDGAPPEELPTCIPETVAIVDQAVLIARVKDYYFADRWLQVPEGSDLELWHRRMAAEWLAHQLYESRLLWLQTGAISATVPWDQIGHLGVPMVQNAQGNEAETRLIVAASYAPLTIFARPLTNGQDAQVFILNDQAATAADLVIERQAEELHRQTMQLSESSAQQIVIPFNDLAALQGEPITLALEVDQIRVSVYKAVIPGPVP